MLYHKKLFEWSLQRIALLLNRDDEYVVQNGIMLLLVLFDRIIGPYLLRQHGLSYSEAKDVGTKKIRAAAANVQVRGKDSKVSGRQRYKLDPRDKRYVNQWEIALIRIKLWVQLFCMKDALELPLEIRPGLKRLCRIHHPIQPGAFRDPLYAPNGAPSVREFVANLGKWHLGHEVAKSVAEDGGHHAGNVNWECAQTNFAKGNGTNAETMAFCNGVTATQWRTYMEGLVAGYPERLRDPESREARFYRFCEARYKELCVLSNPDLYVAPFHQELPTERKEETEDGDTDTANLPTAEIIPLCPRR